MASRKVNFALKARDDITIFAEAMDNILGLKNICDDSGYDVGGSDPIVEEDIEGHDISIQDITSFCIFVDNLYKFLNNEVPLQVDYASAINKFRNM